MKTASLHDKRYGLKAVMATVGWLATLLAAPAYAGSVGLVTLSVGQVMRLPAGVSQSQAAPLLKDDHIYVGDQLVTGPGSHAHLRFVDGGLVSLRDSSTLVITDYQFNAARPEDSKVRFDLQAGVARSITGKAGQSAKHQFRLNTPVAALGVRGTDFAAFSNAKESVFTVNSGVVVVSALGAGCERDALGPCLGPNALELTKLGTHTARVSPSFERPQPVPTVPDALRQAKSTSTPNQQTTEVATSANTNGGVEGTVSAQSSSSDSPSPSGGEKPAGGPLVSAATPKTGPESMSAGPEGIVAAKSDRLGIQEVVAAKVLEPSVPAPSVDPLLVWGHWAKTNNWAEQVHPPANQVLQSLQIAVGNADIGLFRGPLQAADIPQQGVIRFSLASAQVGLSGLATSALGSIQQSGLEVDFGAGSFVTRLAGSQPDIGAFQLQAAGVLGARGSSPGVFLSDPSQSNARVVGALSAGATQAGYFFEQIVSPGTVLTGTTLWRQ